MMVQRFNPAWIFFPFTVLFSAFYFWKGASEPLLAGLVLSAMAGFRIPGSISPSRAFPVFMLLLFMMVLALSPFRSSTRAMLYAAEALLVFRLLLILLSGIQTATSSFNRSHLVFLAGLVIEFSVLLALLYSAFKPVGNEVIRLADALHLKGVAVMATFFTPLWPLGALVSLGFLIPASQPYAGFALIFLASAELVYRITRTS
jgi:hypothetical protein